MAVNRRRELEPTTPSEFLRELMSRYDITQDSLADLLGTTRYSVNQLVNDRRGVTAEMALRLAKVFSNSPEQWLRLQQNVDLARAKRRIGQALKQVRPVRKPSTPEAMFYDVSE
jgi:antitoxin HigA-1